MPLTSTIINHYVYNYNYIIIPILQFIILMSHDCTVSATIDCTVFGVSSIEHASSKSTCLAEMSTCCIVLKTPPPVDCSIILVHVEYFSMATNVHMTTHILVYNTTIYVLSTVHTTSQYGVHTRTIILVYIIVRVVISSQQFRI